MYRRGVGGGFSAAARAGWFARGFRRDLDQDDDDDEDDLWESVVDDINDESAIESLAMEVSGMARGRMADRQRFLEAARAFSQASSANNEVVQRVNPTELLQSATLQAREYQPVWVNPSTLLTTSGRNQVQSSIEWSAERRNVAHLPPYSGHEGRAIRSELPLPRGEGLSQLGLPSPGSNLMPGSRQRAFGFRVAFDHPTCEVGGNMGGGYLVGVTTTSFTSYGESNGLQQTPFFWGIEDAGRRYEGSRRGPPSRSSRRTSSSVPSPFASDIRPDEAPLNTYNVLFGSREVISVVCDIESRTLTYWRDQTLLGTLVTNLPRGSNLYPVVVPVHRGVAVAITGLDGDPLSL